MNERSSSPPVTDARRAFQDAVRLHAGGQLEAAVDAYRAILKEHPKAAACWSNLGEALQQLGRKDEALDVLRQGTQLCPGFARLHHGLGNALAAAGDLEGAVGAYRAALARDPRHRGAAGACGKALFALRRFDTVVDHCGTALQFHADSALLYRLLGLGLWKTGELEAAAAALRRAIALEPATSLYRMELYYVLSRLGLHAEGERVLGKAENADSPHVLAALGNAAISQGRLEQGLEYCNAALAADPDELLARFNRSRANFLAGRYAAAWPDYCWPLIRHKLWGGPRLAGRVWQGEDITGQSILLFCEQGLGDAIQFARYAPLIAQRGARVLLCCAPKLAGLLRRLSDTVEVVPYDRSWRRTDWVCLLMDVPGVLGTDLDSLPNACPYLVPRPRPRPLLPPTRQFRIGIVWAGNPDNQSDRPRSCGLDDFAPLFELPGTEFVSFQVGTRAEELRTSGWYGLVHEAGDEITPFEAAADALLEVDLVITVDTAMAHLAGAAARPVWTLLAFAPDWRWVRGRSDTAWYPTMRLFRQAAPDDWASVFREVRGALLAVLAKPRGDVARPSEQTAGVRKDRVPRGAETDERH